MIKITNVNSRLGGECVTNEMLSQNMDTSDAWIVKRTGIKTRYISKRSLIEDVLDHIEGIEDVEGVDAIIVTTMSNIDMAPTLSSQIANHLQLENSLCFDLNAACSGFVYGLIVANGLIESKTVKRVLLVSCEKMSDIVDQYDRNTAILFGDGIGSATITEGNVPLLSTHFNTCGPSESLVKPSGGSLTMEGQKVFKFATKAISDCIERCILDKGLSLNEVDYFIFHQANLRIIQNIIKKYNLNSDRVICNVETVANTSSASIPILLSTINIKANDKILMVGFGAGLAYGGILYEHN